MNEIEQLRTTVLATFTDVLDGVADDVSATRRDLALAVRDRLEQGRCCVVVCGEFRRGKSSLLNALVGRPGLFPVDVDVTTSVVVTLTAGEPEQATVHFSGTGPDGAVPDPLTTSLDRIADFVTEQGNPENRRQVERVEMVAAIDPPTPGTVLVDTPGVGSLNPAHSTATRGFLANADLVLFVGSAVEPLATVELEFLRLAVERCPLVVTAVTMIDRVPDPGPVVEEARRRIAGLTGLPQDEIVVLPLSSARRQDAQEEQDELLDRRSGFPALEALLRDGLAATVGVQQIQVALDALEELLDEAAAPVENELTLLRDGTRLGELDRELKQARAHALGLRARRSAWTRAVREEIETGSREARRRLEDDFYRIRVGFEASLESDDVLRDPPALVARVSGEMLDAAQQGNQELLNVVTQVAQKYAADFEVPLTTTATALVVPTELRTRTSRTEGQGFRRFRSTWSGGLAGGGLGATTGVVIGSFVPLIGPIIGGIVGGLIGKGWGWLSGSRSARQDAEERARRERVADLRSQVVLMIETGRRRATDALRDQMTDLIREVVRALEAQIEASHASVEESIRRLSADRERTAEERRHRLPEVEAAHQRLTATRRHLTGLRRAADRLEAGAPIRALAARQERGA
ncbi:dynamin family protein [Kineosporia sp. J2-2]|uniref:Dynamin family protein n=1 Tax=Kineosporia corallincola TaxID=2835133 RepID=A0ABS5TR08_9ACTN|nr:dynamin family protein [Kineosporia corallincola]MBT0773264.1 dynamin family protein [Kineosporia corallincola]